MVHTIILGFIICMSMVHIKLTYLHIRGTYPWYISTCQEPCLYFYVSYIQGPCIRAQCPYQPGQSQLYTYKCIVCMIQICMSMVHIFLVRSLYGYSPCLYITGYLSMVHNNRHMGHTMLHINLFMSIATSTVSIFLQ